ncbi:MAG: SpoIIE family protein phosphatase [Bryobacterales bacterium]|nr:SpoIIE family protein phosphatase [Bryobacterales bacterium]
MLTTNTLAQAALREAASDFQRQTQPYILLAGCQITLAIALALIWLRTERQYSALAWLALYLLYACHNLLRFSLLPDFPPSPRFLPAVLSVQLALSIIGRDSRRITIALWTTYATFLAVTANHITLESSRAAVGYTNASIHVIAILIMLGGAGYAEGRTRLVAIVGCCYWILAPVGVLLRQPLLIESPVGLWPVLGLLNVPLTLTVVLLLTAQFAGDRRERIRLSPELEAARVVQQLLLPDANLNSGTLSVEAVYQPALEVGGDFYYIAELDSGAVLVVIGDVTGKGLRAAMVVSLLIGILRETRETSPAAILHRINTGLLRKADAGFVTACCAVFHPGGIAAIATAGHPNPILDGSEIVLPPALPLGCDPDADYSDLQTALPLGSAVTFLSDGVIEASSPSGELFGFERTLRVSRNPPAEIAASAGSGARTTTSPW